MKDAIRLGDSTTHGGKVLEAFSRTDLNGKPIAGVGHKVSCPLCKGDFPDCRGQQHLHRRWHTYRTRRHENRLRGRADRKWSRKGPSSANPVFSL
jgi:hypothetical protein